VTEESRRAWMLKHKRRQLELTQALVESRRLTGENPDLLALAERRVRHHKRTIIELGGVP